VPTVRHAEAFFDVTPAARPAAAARGRATSMTKQTWRLVTRAADGGIVIHDFDSPEGILKTHLQIGADDCSTDLGLRGAPIFRSLVGPMPEGRTIVRYETPEVFEALTKEWATPKPPRRRRRGAAAGGDPAAEAATTDG
jgi:hypothetical protein